MPKRKETEDIYIYMYMDPWIGVRRLKVALARPEDVKGSIYIHICIYVCMYVYIDMYVYIL